MTFLCSMVLMPHSIIYAPIAFYIYFMCLYIFLNNFAIKPISNSNSENTGFFIYIYLTISQLLFTASIAMLYLWNIKHSTWISNPDRNCGSFNSNESWHDLIKSWI